MVTLLLAVFWGVAGAEVVQLSPEEERLLPLPKGAVITDSGGVHTVRLKDENRSEVAYGDLNAPFDLLFDPQGRLYVANAGDGEIVRFSGHSRERFYGEDQEGFFPCALALDQKGGLAVADCAQHRVLYLDRNGLLQHTLEGDWLKEPAGVVFDRHDRLYISDRRSHLIWRLSGWDEAPEAYAGQGQLALMSHNTTLSRQSLSLRHPRHLAIAPDGAVVVADYGNNRILALDENGTARVLIGPSRGHEIQNRPVGRALIDRPFSVAFDPSGQLYFSDHLTHSIARIHQGRYERILGTLKPGTLDRPLKAEETPLYYPRGLSFSPSGEALYVADYLNDQILRYGPIEALRVRAPAREGHYTIHYRASDRQERYDLEVGDLNQSDLNQSEQNSTTLSPLEPPKERLSMAALVDLAAGLLPAEAEHYALAQAVALLPQNPPLFASLSDGIYRQNPDGLPQRLAGSGAIAAPIAIAQDAQGRLYVADRARHQVLRQEEDGEGTIRWVAVAGSGQLGFLVHEREALKARLNHPNDIAFDRAGNLYIADRGNHLIQRVSPGGRIEVFAGSGEGDSGGYGGDGGPASEAQINQPTGLAIDLEAQRLYVADYANHAIRQIDLKTGTITTLAGTGQPGFSGDGGLAKAAQLNHPYRVRLTGGGGLLVADTHNNRIRHISAQGRIKTLYGDGRKATLFHPTDMAIFEGRLVVADFANDRVVAVKLEPDLEVIE
jgi:sugar lactone lactonase YvrE